MKVLLLNTLYYPNVVGGAEKSVQFLAEALVKKGIQVTVVSTHHGQSLKVEYLNNVKVYYLPLSNIYWPFSDSHNGKNLFKPVWHLIDSYNTLMSKKFQTILCKEEPDLVHTNNLRGFSVAVWPKIKEVEIPIVHTIRDYNLMCPRSTMFNGGKNCEKQCLICRAYSTIKKWNSKHVDSVVGISRFILDRHLAAGYFPSTIKNVIFNAYENNTPIQPKEPTSVFRIGYIGQLNPVKGIDVLLDSVDLIAADNWSLHVAGKGDTSYQKSLISRSSEKIEYLGFVKPEEFFSKIDVLVVPSIWNEPLSRTTFEAYAHGVPVIGSDRGGIPELIEEGRTGFLFNPNNPQTLVEKLEFFMNNRELLQKFSVNCLKKATEFTGDAIAQSYIEVYNRSTKKQQ